MALGTSFCSSPAPWRGERDARSRRAEVAHAAGCGCWLVADQHYLVLPSGEKLRVRDALPWVVSAVERKALLAQGQAGG
jgi:hypothetical protein